MEPKKAKLKKNLNTSATTRKSTKTTGLTVSVFDTKGEVKSNFILPEAVFKKSVQPQLLAQAIRVYQTNRRQGTAMTKTRSEVAGSTRKIYRQKGTGRARHGDIKAPIFVGGGIIFGPRRTFPKRLDLPDKMRQLALKMALSEKAANQAIKIITGLTKASGKTKDIVGLLEKLQIYGKKLLLVLDKHMDTAKKAARNIACIRLTTPDNISTLMILENEMIIFSQEALETFLNRYQKK